MLHKAALFHPFYSFYTQTIESAFTVKFADDATLVGLLRETEACYRNEINDFVEWGNSNFLFLNVNKTKEIITDFKSHKKL